MPASTPSLPGPEECRLSESDVNITKVAEGALISSYLQKYGGAVGFLGGLDNAPAEIKANGGQAPVTFAYSDYGVNQSATASSPPRKRWQRIRIW